MNKVISIIILAISQGIAEFLPISSSAHLIILRDLFGIGKAFIGKDIAMAFDIALHFGTLLAIAIYFFPKLWKLLIDGLKYGPFKEKGRLFWSIILASVPAAIFGLLFEDVIDEFFRGNFIIIAIALAFMGIIIYLCDSKAKNEKTMEEITYLDALIIGLAQVFALIPGFSRSGTTISAARSRKIKRVDAANYSFYLSIPVVFGAVLLSVVKEAKTGFAILSSNAGVFLLGFGVSFITGILVIHFFLKYLKKNDFKIFMIYRFIISAIIILTVIIK